MSPATEMESIYKWIEPAPVRPERPPLYHSKHDPQKATLAGSTIGVSTHNRTAHATLGTDQLKHTIHPDKFLKAGEKSALDVTVTRMLRELPALVFFGAPLAQRNSPTCNDKPNPYPHCCCCCFAPLRALCSPHHTPHPQLSTEQLPAFPAARSHSGRPKCP